MRKLRNYVQNVQTQSQRKTRQEASPTSSNSAHAGARPECTLRSRNELITRFESDDYTSERRGLGRSPFPVPGRCGGRWNTDPALPATPPSPATSCRTSRLSRTWPRGKCVRQPFRGRGPLISRPTVFLAEACEKTRRMTGEIGAKEEPGNGNAGTRQRVGGQKLSTDDNQDSLGNRMEKGGVVRDDGISIEHKNESSHNSL